MAGEVVTRIISMLLKNMDDFFRQLKVVNHG